ncbi:GH32 C-terminal domain-containing protein [Zongyangia hominis]|uniref:GH32 C-terminal domain-containing protein n=1 Tax=Zongyangia hominis TaxID=2763677 RepID=A0A926EAJ2_9FIRM|nr:GH32 C-terminal domain-containing protein [Zongyangia hominis]MBC8570337.1 GH32 C-terminal domain-containing protein [Zongyangia hominis]
MQNLRKRRGSRLFALILALSMVVTMFVPLQASAAGNSLGNLTGDYKVEGDAVIANAATGNNFVISDTYAETFIFEADMSFVSGGTGGLLFNTAGPNDPGADWCALHIGSGSARLFCEGNHLDTVNGLEVVGGLPAGAAAPYQLKLEVSKTNIKVSVDGTIVIDKDYTGLSGGYVGFMSYGSAIKFENIKFTDTATPPSEVLGKLSGNYFSVDPDTGAVTVEEVPAEVGDKNNFVVSETFSKAFVYEADMTFLNGGTGGLVFNCATSTSQGGAWCGSCVRGGSEIRLFCEGNWGDKENGLDVFLPLPEDATQPYHLRLEVTPEGVMTVDVDGKRVIEKTYQNKIISGGYVGFMTWNSSAKFENVKFTDNTPPIVPNFKTNIEGWAGQTGEWKAMEEGYQGSGANNFAAFSTTSAKNFSYSMDLTFSGGGAGGPIFRAKPDGTAYYIATLSRGGTARILRFTQDKAGKVTGERQIGGTYNLPENKETYKIRVETYGPSVNLYVDDILAVTGSDDELLEGVFGLNLFNCIATYQNVYYEEKDPSSVSLLTGLKAEGVTFTPPYSPDVYSYKGLVPFSTDKITLTPTVSGEGDITIAGLKAQNGQPCEVPLEVGENAFTISVKDKQSGFVSSVNFKIKRQQDPELAYREKYRNQFHFSEEANWMNDPNGLMYDATTGLYHMYYQYAAGEGTTWGHAISTDLVAWTELPVAIPVDSLGNIWSGCGIIDEKNTSGLFDESTPPASRLVAIYTNQGGDETYGNQKQSLAYSTDYGTTWIKYSGNPVIKNEGNKYGEGFRDPKVQWIEDASHKNGGFWLMIVAGGRGRIFTSDNLIDWTLNDELVYHSGGEIHSECPDFFCLPVNGDPSNLKWVYTGGGTFYVVGDLVKGADGLYKFKAETDNIAPLYTGGDMYATQSYFNDAKGGRRILVSWMVDRFQSPADGKVWQGAQSLPLETTLKYKNGRYLLNSYPVEEVDSVRKDLIYSKENITVTPDTENILKDVSASLCDIEATFTPEGASSFGFNLRTKDDQKIVVTYNTQTQRISVDRTHCARTDITSGIYDMALVPMDNGKVKLRVLVDTSIIDVFGNDGESSTNCFYYVDPENAGMEFFTVGGNVTVDSMNIYSMKSTWREMERPGIPEVPDHTDAAVMTDISLSEGTLTPSFSKDEKNYTAEVANAVDTIRVTPTFTGDGKVYVGGKEVANGAASDEISLKEGANTILVQLTSNNGEEVTYTIVVTRLGAGTEPTTKPNKPGKPTTPGGSGSDWKWPEGSGSATGGKQNPQSGDHSALPAALALLAGATVVAVAVTRKKHR